MLKGKTLIIFAVFCLLMLPFVRPVFGADYDLYVDVDAGSGGDGSSSNPFQKIEDALDEADSGDKIYVRSGEYDGDFTINSGVHLKGESESEVDIDGPIVMKDGSSIANLTISGGKTAITVQEDAKITIDECTIKDFSRIGINIVAGNGELAVENANIHSGSGKGFYVEKGNRLELTSSKVHDNGEEGVDIRKNVDGYVVANEIYDNGESGIEVILGSADLEIKNNAIENNGSSGVAVQYYEDADKPGGIKIKSNVIKNNEKFGIDCNLPHGGNPKENYWSKGLDVEKNELKGNNDGRISSICKLVEFDEGDGGEEYDEDKEESVNGNSLTDDVSGDGKTAKEEEETARRQQEEREKTRQQKEYMEGKLEEILKDFDKNRKAASEALAVLEKENKVWFWFWGPDMENLNSLKQSKATLEEKILELDSLIVEAGDNPVVVQLRDKRQTLQEDKDFIEQKISNEGDRFSMYVFLGWIFGSMRS